MYKLVVSGFDEVLIDSEEAISTSTIMEIDRVRNMGCKFCVSTDRCLDEVLCYNRDFHFIDYVIACGGAYLYDVLKEKTIYKKCITSSILKKIISIFSNYSIYGSTENSRCLVNDISDNKIYKLEIECSNKNDCIEVRDKLEKLNLNINFWTKKTEKKYLIVIIMGNVNQCIAVEKICILNKITLDEVMGIGVSDRDIEMIQIVGCGVAMKNSVNSLKKVADKVTNSNDEKGVKKVLSQLVK